MTLDNAPGIPSFTKDSVERSGKTLLQVVVSSALVLVTDLHETLPDRFGDDVNLALFVPAISVGLSWVTSWLSRYKGSPDTASLVD